MVRIVERDTFGMLGYATCAKLYSYQDKPGEQGVRVVPEIATGYPVISHL